MIEKIKTQEELIQQAPAVFSNVWEQEKLSQRYKFFPTYKILDFFENFNWKPVNAYQSKSRVKNPFTSKHILRLRHENATAVMPEVGSLIPEIVVKNSHDGTTGLQIHLGLFRLVCSNGLVVANSMIADFKFRHMGIEMDDIYRVTVQMQNKFDEIWNKIYEYKTIYLTDKQKLDFATQVVEYNWKNRNMNVEPEKLIIPRRDIDNADDLFTTYNVIQENLTKGGILYINPRYNTFRYTRRIKDGHRDFNVNCFLWQLMENFYKYQKFVVE